MPSSSPIYSCKGMPSSSPIYSCKGMPSSSPIYFIPSSCLSLQQGFSVALCCRSSRMQHHTNLSIQPDTMLAGSRVAVEPQQCRNFKERSHKPIYTTRYHAGRKQLYSKHHTKTLLCTLPLQVYRVSSPLSSLWVLFMPESYLKSCWLDSETTGIQYCNFQAA
jgi:hypothetical protein